MTTRLLFFLQRSPPFSLQPIFSFLLLSLTNRQGACGATNFGSTSFSSSDTPTTHSAGAGAGWSGTKRALRRRLSLTMISISFIHDCIVCGRLQGAS
uniref:Uncharacterized protein n=1 Tax=Setaria viridis TaxID=4556 RepID=A0A4U6W6R0_SETVI|nr:hypothetical protein SEVIR_1G029420v2 [Setaria viridis]